MMSNRILSHIQDKENDMKTSGIKRKGVVTDENSRVLSTKDSVNKPQQPQSQQQKGFATRRIPLGGKNHNSNNLSLNRSQSSLNSKLPVQSFSNARPPTLAKSNSSLGFSAPLQQLQEQQHIPPIIHQEEQQPPAKKILLESLKDEGELHMETSMPDSFSDCLTKNSPPVLPSIENLESTLTTETNLHASNVINDDINRNNVDPVKREARLNNIDRLVESHWQEPIETILESTNQVRLNLDSLNESELQFFSTPNDSFELNGNGQVFEQADKSFELDFDDESNVADVAIIHDADEEIGLTNEDLNNLLG